MTKEFIEKDAARRIISSPRSKEQMLRILENLPPVKVEPKHGRWVIKYGDGHTEPAITGGECSICGYVHTATNYCPNCGALMN